MSSQQEDGSLFHQNLGLCFQPSLLPPQTVLPNSGSFIEHIRLPEERETLTAGH